MAEKDIRYAFAKLNGTFNIPVCEGIITQLVIPDRNKIVITDVSVSINCTDLSTGNFEPLVPYEDYLAKLLLSPIGMPVQIEKMYDNTNNYTPDVTNVNTKLKWIYNPIAAGIDPNLGAIVFGIDIRPRKFAMVAGDFYTLCLKVEYYVL